MAELAVCSDELHGHAARLIAFSRQITDCAAAAHRVDFGVDTFGVIGQLFSVALREFSAQQRDRLESLAELVQDRGARIRAIAEDYQYTDCRTTDALASIGGGR